MSDLKKTLFKTPVLIGAAVVISIASLWYFNGKSKDEPSLAVMDADYAKYISAYTSGVVSSEEKIRVILAQNVLDSVKR
jgi:hypothetical protein